MQMLFDGKQKIIEVHVDMDKDDTSSLKHLDSNLNMLICYWFFLILTLDE